MNHKTNYENKFTQSFFLFLLGTAIGMLFVGQNVVAVISTGQQFIWIQGLLFEMIYWYAWAAIVPLTIYAAKRYRIERSKWLSAITKHFIYGFFIACAQVFLSYSAFFLIILAFNIKTQIKIPDQIPRYFPYMIVNVITGIWKYWIVIGIYYAFDYYRKYQEREAKAAQLEKSLVSAELQNLKMQIHPHFLFNTLHAISVLMIDNVKSATQMLIHLSDLLRVALDSSGIQEVTVAEELAFIKRYLDIEKIRFQGRLNTSLKAETETLDALLPFIILQPLVENSIRHGIETRAGIGIIDVVIRRVEEELQITVSDNGIGINENSSAEIEDGIGWKNIRSRLSHLYENKYEFQIIPPQFEGLSIRIKIPFRISPVSKDISGDGEN